jgi:serine/threonine-protein kinase
VLGRDVAIKVLREKYFQHTSFSSRFENEARAAALISHPNVIQVFDYGREQDAAYIVMQYVPGPSLKDYIREDGPLTVEESIELARQILDGLAAIHDAGIIHRDVKPQNVLLTDSRQVKLTDFGIARLETGASGLTESGTALGTAAYMAPEQASGQNVTAASDLYSVGVILYEMLTGRLPFPGDNPVQVMYRHVNELPPPPRSLNRQIPVGTEALILRALAKEPADRFQTARAMRDALLTPAGEAVVVPARQPTVDPTDRTAVTPVVAGPATRRAAVAARRPPARRRGSRWPVLIPLLVLLALAGLLGTIAIAGQLGNGGEGADPTEPAAAIPTEIAAAPTATVAVAAPTETATATPPVPTATATLSPTPEPTATPETPTPTAVPPTPTSAPPTPTPAPPTATVPTSGVPFNTPVPLSSLPAALLQGPSVTLEADDFYGAYRRPDGMLYGLPAVHIYGQDSGAEAASADFDVDEAPDQYLLITITGMDDEREEHTSMQLWLNDNLIWEGPSPFNNEEWTDVAWLVEDLEWLEAGTNTLTVANTEDDGEVGSPPWILVTSAVVYFDQAPS